MTRSLRIVVLAAAYACTAACDSGSPPAPTPNPDPGAGARTITITSSGANPRQLTVPPGTRVLFTNNDTRAHQMTSDPHPEHTDCPEINQVGNLVPGQTKETGNLNTVRTCAFHDHDNPGSTTLQGRIVIQ
jgi:plastocyanin